MLDISYGYSSLQTTFNEDFNQKVIKWGYDNIPDDILYIDPEHTGLGRENEIHLTVLYGIATRSPELIKNVFKNEKPFVIQLGDINCFRNEQYDVIKIHVHGGQSLGRLHKIAQNDIKHKTIYDNFEPHITIAYVKPTCANEVICRSPVNVFTGTTVEVNSLLFSCIDGTRHQILLNNSR